MKMKKITLLFALSLMISSIHAQNWQLDWSDEFNGSGSPNATIWTMENWAPGVVNSEDQAYTDRLENVRVENGNLVIEARKDNYNGWEWTSGRLHTSGKKDILYGRVEVRAMLPAGAGTWPAIWALPSDWVYGNWPTVGEIDIMEHVGKDPGNVHASIHTESYNHTINTQRTAQIDVPDFSTAFHVYTLEWSPTEIKMFVDDVNYFTFQNEGTGYQEWPFDKPFHVILNVAMGGTWGGRISRQLSSVKMLVDYVRVYSTSYPADTQAPTTPAALTGNPGGKAINLSWTPSSDNFSVKEYDVYLDNSLYQTTNQHAVYINGLQPLTSYDFKVRARDYAGNVSGFATATISTTDVQVNNIPAKIEAESYDGQSGVQLEATQDTGGGDNVGWIDAGDWMEYTIGVATAGDFIVDYRIASLSTGGEIHLLDGSSNLLTATVLPVTGGWQTWTTVTSSTFSLPAGTSTIRVYANQSGWNFNWMEFKSVSSGGTSMHVQSIVTTTQSAGQGNKNGVAQITVHDNDENPVAGATVSGTFSGTFNESFSGQTGANGVVTFVTSASAKGGVTVNFCVDNVTGSLTYNSAQNDITCTGGGARTSPEAGAAQSNAALQVFPNPSPDGRFSILLPKGTQLNGEVSISILDLQGKLVYQSTQANVGTLLSVDTPLQQGLYLLRLKHPDLNFESRLLIK